VSNIDLSKLEFSVDNEGRKKFIVKAFERDYYTLSQKFKDYDKIMTLVSSSEKVSY
jgi:hypothetical protein